MSSYLNLLIRLLKPLFWLLIVLTTFLMLIELKPQATNYMYVDKLQHIVVFVTLTLIGLYAYPINKRAVAKIFYEYASGKNSSCRGVCAPRVHAP